MKYLRLSFCFLLLFAFSSSLSAQDIKYERSRHTSMLKAIKEDIKKNYYDPNFHGINLDERFALAEQKIKEAASIGQMSGIIAQVLVDFKDSHLFFVPPGKANKTKYGFDMQMFGDRCHISRVHEKSDAYKKGLRVGDQLVSIETFAPNKENLWLINYFFRALRPKPVLNLEISKDGEKVVPLQIEAKIVQGRLLLDLANSPGDLSSFIRESENSYYESRKQFVFKKEKDYMIWQMPAFNLSPDDMDSMIGKADGLGAIIIDLRGNGGGRVDSLTRLISNFFDKDIKIGDEKTRKGTKEVVAKSRGKKSYQGKLAILIDSESGSASEVFAKVVQLEKRGKIYGDISAGAVMASRYFGHEAGVDIVAPYGASITVADLIMTDGKSLERIGVTPDEVIIPKGSDIANKRDIVLSKALKDLGFEMSPEEAGGLFTKEKEKYKDDY